MSMPLPADQLLNSLAMGRPVFLSDKYGEERIPFRPRFFTADKTHQRLDNSHLDRGILATGMQAPDSWSAIRKAPRPF